MVTTRASVPPFFKWAVILVALEVWLPIRAIIPV